MATETKLPVGARIQLPGHFDAPVILEEARPLPNGYECRVRLADGTLEEAVISKEEAAALSAGDHLGAAKATLVDAEKLRLLIESARIRLAYAHDRQFAVSLSGIRTLPHQIEAVYQKMLPQPRLRFLLADDPGAGKTIMAGLLIKELKLREAVERVLILCPAPLTIQRQDEMLRWFGETFDIIFAAVDQQQLTNPWQRSSQIVVSLDYAKQDSVRERIWQQRWDLVIIDEAHKCSARTKPGGAGREASTDPTKRYELAAKLTSQADHVLLLTATPHHGDEDKFAHFLRLIDPDLFPEPHRLGKQAEQIRKEVFRLGRDCPWALRRLKEDLRDLDGQRLFPDRHAITVAFSLNAEEFALYKTVTAYINEFMPQQTGQRRSSAALARTGPVRHVATALVLPPTAGDTADLGSLFGDRDPKTELAAEDFVINHLVTKEGFRREDCQRVGNVRFAGNKREGFDIGAVKLLDEATGAMEVRRIEVKGRKRGGNIVLTTNEWFKAQQLGEHYWLCVVWDPLGQSPELVAIQNPVQKLDHAKREIIASRYYEIPADAVEKSSARFQTGTIGKL